MATITIKKLLESGVHFGHFIKKRHPQMSRSEYIFTKRNGIDIIDLQKTFDATKKAYEIVRDEVRKGKKVLFLGTKKQAQDIMAEQAKHCGMYYINKRWCGGLFTNFAVVKHSIQEYQQMEKMEEEGESINTLTKKELSAFRKKKAKLEKMWAGVKDMRVLPDIIFVIDSKKEEAAIVEAKKMGIFVIAVVDTNSDPTNVDHVIPANDDAIRSISLFASVVADAVLDGIQGEEYQMFDENHDQDDLNSFQRDNLEERERVESNEEWAAKTERYQDDK